IGIEHRPSKPAVTGSSPVGRATLRRDAAGGNNGGCSSAGRVPDCDSGCRGFESHQPPHFPLMETSQADARELAELVAELERAEAFEQRLRQIIADARDQLAAGNAAVALSMLNAALSDIDAATDVVTPSSRPTST